MDMAEGTHTLLVHAHIQHKTTQAARRQLTPWSCRYGVIRSLLRVLVDGQAAKDVLDAAVDANSAMQNLREAIAGQQASATSLQQPLDGLLWLQHCGRRIPAV